MQPAVAGERGAARRGPAARGVGLAPGGAGAAGHRPTSRTSTCGRCRSPTRWRSAPSKPMVVRQLAARSNLMDDAGAAHRARRTRPATSSPTTCSTGRRCCILLRLGARPLSRLPFFAGLPLLAIRLALLEWFRAAELSCDRAATLVNRSPMTTCQTMMVMAGGAAVAQAQPRRVRQARPTSTWTGSRAGTSSMRFGRELTLTHPYPVRRVHELMKWVRSGDYDRIMSGEYVRARRRAPTRARRPATPPSTTPSKFRTIFKEAGDGRRQGRRQGGRRRRQAVGLAEAEVVRRHRLGEVVALRDVAAQVAQRGRLLGGLDALGHGGRRRARGRAAMTAVMIARVVARSRGRRRRTCRS